MPYRNHKTDASHFGLCRYYWRPQCYEKPTPLGKNLLMLLAVISAYVISVFNYSIILMFA